MSRKKPAWARHKKAVSEPETTYPEACELMGNNIQITITGNGIWARQTGPNSVEVGDAPGRGSYDPRTHVVVSRDSLAALLDYWFGDCPNDKFASACQGANKLRAALEGEK